MHGDRLAGRSSPQVAVRKRGRNAGPGGSVAGHAMGVASSAVRGDPAVTAVRASTSVSSTSMTAGCGCPRR